MQPYLFPYVGYFQLINSVDKFVFYDDVNYIKRGWINRNKILINNKEHLLSFPCVNSSQNKLIKDVKIEIGSKEYEEILLKIKRSYIKSPYFESIFPLIELIFKSKNETISDFACNSVVVISKYLGLDTEFFKSSKLFNHFKELNKEDRLIKISKELGGENYINAIGGIELYNKAYFKKNGINLNFLKPKIKEYTQFGKEFIPGLSIIDVLMFNSKVESREIINDIELI